MLSVESIPACHLNRTLGALQTDQNGSRFCVWSPTSSHVQVDLVDQNRQVELQKTKAGYHVADVEGVTAGDRYFYRFDDSPRLPDPASRYQIGGVHGPSVVGHPAFDWSDQDWQGIPREELVIYELHIGAFTDQGTFES